MSSLYLAWKNATAKPLRFLFNILLIALASGLICLAVLINIQFSHHFEKNLTDVDLILSAKGSPLQSVLCNMFHIDVPTGNISLSESKVFLNEQHPLIKKALPLSLGDQYEGFRLVGTTLEVFDWYKLSLQQGTLFNKDFQAVLGSEAARILKFSTDSNFYSAHGLVQDDLHHHDDHQFSVTGILNPTGGISDRLIFVPISSYWLLHAEHSHDHDEHESNDHEHPLQLKTCLTNKDLMEQDNSITAMLLSFKGKNIQALNFGRSINENTGLMASYPAIELNRMYELTGSATDLLSYLAGLLIILATLGLFINLWQAMEDRKYEMALLRLGGASPGKIVGLIIMESFILSVIGLMIGIFSAHLFLIALDSPLHLQTRYGISGFQFFKEELWIFVLGFTLGILASLIPAIKSIKRDIHKTLTDI